MVHVYLMEHKKLDRYFQIQKERKSIFLNETLQSMHCSNGLISIH